MYRNHIVALFLVVASGASAQHAHQSAEAKETGQAQFAAIAQIVAALRDDDDTDWSRVDIAALRAHLVDMDNVTTRASMARTVDGSNVTFTVTGEDTVAASIGRMVMAHSPMLAQASGWDVRAALQSDGATMTVMTTSDDELAEVLGLGFFGLMTIGAHHQQHHIMIASGMSPH